jgi:hypothetical protein
VPFKPCPGGCGRLIPTSQSRCDECQEGAWREREHGARAAGRRTSTWRKTAREILQSNPTCLTCGSPSRHVAHADGVNPNEPGGLNEDELLPLCGKCHASHKRSLARKRLGLGGT